MAINISFNGATILKPGSYSKVNIDLGGAFPLSPAGLVALFGESSSGAPGADEVNIADNVFSPEQIPQIQAKYGSGALVDAMNFLFAPGADGALPSGAQAVYIYKTNSSTKASLVNIPNSWGDLESRTYGTAGNLYTYRNTIVPETPATTEGSVTVAPSAVDFALGTTLSIQINGAAPIDYVVAASADRAALLSNLNGAFSGLTFSASGDDNIVITQNAGSNLHRNGNGRSFEVLSSTGATAFGFTTGLHESASEPMAALQLKNSATSLTESDNLGGEHTLRLGFKSAANDATAATVAISATSLTLTVTGGAQAGSNVLTLASYATISQLVDAINLLPKVSGDGWQAEVSTTAKGLQNPSVLDRVSATGALSEGGLLPARIKQDASDVRSFFELSTLMSLEEGTNSRCGLPDAQTETALTGGTLGGTLTSDITDALSKFQKIRVNSVVPLFSRDATDDIADGLTDPTSNYTIAGIHQAVKTHLSLMSTTKNRSERQGYLSLKASYNECKEVSGNLAYERIQLAIQDMKNVDAQGVLKWFQPWAGACLLAGARGGSPVGTPLTFKYFNVSGIRQTAQPMTTPDQNITVDFDPDLQYDDAISNGITFWEKPQSGGFRLVVDNTTYGQDANWLKNRANVLYAADTIAYNFRTQMENIYVGMKNTVSPAEIKSTAESILTTFLAQGITVSTPDAKNGFKSLVVQINGNVVNISVIVKLVEGIDFILSDITLQRAQTSA